jgi:hypothetical protein
MKFAPVRSDTPERALSKVPSPAQAILVSLSLALGLGQMQAVLAQESPAPAANPKMVSLGGERYQIGAIVVDRKARRFALPARVHVLNKPLEYLLTTKGGMKEYETLLETDVTGTEFNLACILLGLERDPTLEPYMQFSQKRVAGPRVEVTITRKDGDRAATMNAGEVLFDTDAKPGEPVEWVYVGSQKHWQDGRFAADVTGTLIGFVHDPNTIVESALGLGIGAYGSVNGDAERLPPVGSDVELAVSVPEAGATKK